MYLRGAVLLYRFVKEHCRTNVTTFRSTWITGTIEQHLSAEAADTHVLKKSPMFRQPETRHDFRLPPRSGW